MFKITYDSRVKDDINGLSNTTKIRIQKVISEKLTKNPEVFGKPLRYSLVGFRSLRVGDYRVVFTIRKEKEIFVTLITHRKNVYKEILKRT